MGWREEIETAIQAGALDNDPVKRTGALAILAALELPPANRIALARELLAGTGRVVARDVDAPEIATSWFAGGWVACRATMLADDGENND